ncbi:hypothetical protein BpHYR1_039362 [Brachionus plicatilis]|nr:hypothetical protein BpHYR1_039362 [Brachionus plicatilis]
MLPLLMF